MKRRGHLRLVEGGKETQDERLDLLLGSMLVETSHFIDWCRKHDKPFHRLEKNDVRRGAGIVQERFADLIASLGFDREHGALPEVGSAFAVVECFGKLANGHEDETQDHLATLNLVVILAEAFGNGFERAINQRKEDK